MSKKKFIWEFEEEKIRKREKEKERLRKKKKEKRRKQRRRNILIGLAASILFLLFIITPIFKVNKIEVVGNKFFDSQKIQNDIDYGEHFSPVEFFLKNILPPNKLNYLNSFHSTYNIKNGTVTINVNEKIPFYHDETGQNYYLDKKGRIQKWEINYGTPLVKTLDEEVKEEFFQEFKDLNYDIRAQIKSVEMADEEIYGKEVIKLNMQDKNSVYIYSYQISYKMNYYNQMKQILEENEKGPGNIYLYIGDYYEEYK